MGKQQFRRQRDEMFDAIEERIKVEMPTRKTPNEIANCLNNILYEEFARERKIPGGGMFSLNPKFVGQYIINPANPNEIITFAHVGKGCSPLPLKGGIIGRAIRTGRSQYVPNVHKDPDHVSCNEEMNGSEAVYLSISKPYTSGPDEGRKIPYAVLDVDLDVEDSLPRIDFYKIGGIWRRFDQRIFGSEPAFIAPEYVARFEGNIRAV